MTIAGSTSGTGPTRGPQGTVHRAQGHWGDRALGAMKVGNERRPSSNSLGYGIVWFTLPKTNIAPTNGWLEYYFPIGEAYFQGLR